MGAYDDVPWGQIDPDDATVTAEQFEARESHDGYEWFQSSSILRHIMLWAQAQDVNPHAGLAVVLARIASNLHPCVQLPRLGTLPFASLNTFVGLAGASGDGKSGLLDSVDLLMPRPHDDPVTRIGVSTGEGLVTTFVVRHKERGQPWADERVAYQAFAIADEVATMQAVSARTGNTLDSTMRTMWTGSTVSQPNADPSRRRYLEGHTYRLAFITGIQPGKGDIILGPDAQIVGMPQRFVFANVRDPLLTMDAHVDDPGPLHFEVHPSIPYEPRFGHGDTSTPRTPITRYVFPVAPGIQAALTRENRRRKMGDEKALDGHWMLTKLRVAALLAILHGKREVDFVAWDWADRVMTHSNQTRSMLLEARTEETRRENAARGIGDAERGAAADAVRIRAGGDRVLAILDAHRHKEPGHVCSRRCLTRGMSKPQCDVLPLIVESLVGGGVLIVEDVAGNGGASVRYRRP